MSIETEELLLPRRKVIEKYPHSPYNIGDLVEITITRCLLTVTQQYSEFHGKNVDVESYVPLSTIDEYPHLFKKIEWWEERKVEGMPEYVHFKEGAYENYFKVKKHFITNDWCSVNHPSGHPVNYPYASLTPASHEEYLTYQNQLK